MILYQVTKYLLIDHCFGVFFEQFVKNVKTDKFENLPLIGDTFKKIVSKDNSEMFYNCKILDVYLSDDASEYYIDFEYDEYDFNDAFEYDDDEYEDDDLSESVEDILDAFEDDDEIPADDDFDGPNTDTVPFSEFNFIK